MLLLAYNMTIMFCPNCAAQNNDSQHYCRMCGLRLDAISAELTLQKRSDEFARLFKRGRQAHMLAVYSLLIAGCIGIGLLLAEVTYYKLMILGPEILFGSALGAVILFLLASVFFFRYPKLFLKRLPANEQAKPASPTNKLLDDPPFEPASVTEHSTELLLEKR